MGEEIGHSTGPEFQLVHGRSRDSNLCAVLPDSCVRVYACACLYVYTLCID